MDVKRVQKIAAYIGLAAICVATISVALPIIDRYIDDPNLIAYFNHDESFLMGLIWYYYGGQKGPYYQFTSDYGVEMLYIADLSRLFLSKFITFTPGRFVLILRWLQLIFWILSLVAAWRLVKRHFGSTAQALAVTILLAVNAGSSFIIHSSKPDPIALFFTLSGLNYAMRLLNSRRRSYIVIASASAALATVVKFSGVFLLPAIITAVYLSAKVDRRGQDMAPKIAAAWTVPALIGLAFIVLPLISVFSYVRQGSGMTWYEEFGLLGSILRNRSLLFMNILGGMSIAFSALLYLTARGGSRFFGMRMDMINELASSSAFVIILFIFFMAIFGFVWLVNPVHFIMTYSVMIPVFFDGIMKSSSIVGSLSALAANFVAKNKDFNLPIFMLFLLYLFMEVKNWNANIRIERARLFKRFTMASFAVSVLPAMFFVSHMKWYHMMPFFVVYTILAMQIPSIDRGRAAGLPRRVVTAVIFICFTASALYNGYASFRTFRGSYEWRKDKVFKIVKWWRESYPVTTPIVADSPIFVYIPPDYEHVWFLRSQDDRPSQLNRMIKNFKPRVVCYNTFRMPSIEDMLPDTKVKLVAAFDDPSGFYANWPGIKYVVYEVAQTGDPE